MTIRRETAASGPGPGVAVCAPTDAELAVRSASGDRSAFEVLVNRWQGRVFRFVLVRVRDEHDAAEVTQETLMRAFRSIGRYHSGRSFSTWLFAIAHRESVNVIRRRLRSARDAQRTIEPSDSDGDELPDVWALARRVLDDKGFEAVWLRYVEDLEAGEIAVVMGRSAVGVRVLLHRARTKLASALEETSGVA